MNEEEELMTEQVVVDANGVVHTGTVRPSWAPGIILVVTLLAIYIFLKFRKKRRSTK